MENQEGQAALYGLRTSPIAWETERDNALRELKWTHDKVDYRLLTCHGSPCLWTVVPTRPGEDPSVKTSREELTRCGHHVCRRSSIDRVATSH